MTISSSLNAGVSGLASNATRLGTISDNIANASTMGYKRVETDFQSVVIGANGGTYTAGGVRASTYRLIDERGSIVGTNNGTDIAIRGGGFIPVAQASEVTSGETDPMMYLTSTGSFRPDQQGYLRTESGLMLLGWPAQADGTISTYPRDSSQGLEPVQMTLNELTSNPTTQIDFGINLPTTSSLNEGLATEYTVSLEYFDHMGQSQQIYAAFEPIDDGVGGVTPNQWRMTIYSVPVSQATPADRLGIFDLTYDNSGANGGALQSVTIPTAVAGAGLGDLDGLGNHLPYITIPDPDPAAPDNSQQLNLFVGTPLAALGNPDNDGRDGMTQLGDTFAPLNVGRDGSPAGRMTSVDIDENGFVTANFDNGSSRLIYQVPLADVTNPNGMLALDRQTFMPTAESGGFVLWNAGSGPVGEVVSFAREESATDVAAELTDLIQTQRAYSSNAKVIQTVDEMLQETTNIKR